MFERSGNVMMVEDFSLTASMRSSQMMITIMLAPFFISISDPPIY